MLSAALIDFLRAFCTQMFIFLAKFSNLLPKCSQTACTVILINIPQPLLNPWFISSYQKSFTTLILFKKCESFAPFWQVILILAQFRSQTLSVAATDLTFRVLLCRFTIKDSTYKFWRELITSISLNTFSFDEFSWRNI